MISFKDTPVYFLDGEIKFIASHKIDRVSAIRLFSGSTATFAPINPIFTPGLIALIISAVFTSDLKDGVEVCITTKSRFLISERCPRNSSHAEASISFEPRPMRRLRSQVGYQKERTSRFI